MKLEPILNRYRVPQTDRPALRALIDLGMRPNARIAAECRDGKYKALMDDALTVLSAALPHQFPT